MAAYTAIVGGMNDQSTLRIVLKLDAAASAALGAIAAVGGSLLDSVLGLPAALLHPLGALLLVWAAAVAWVATRPEIPRAGVMAIVDLNVAWVLASVALVALDWFTPTAAGVAVTLAQAAAVAVLAALQALYGSRTTISSTSSGRSRAAQRPSLPG